MPSWRSALRGRIKRCPPQNPKVVLLGVGQEFGGDDGAGLEVVRRLLRRIDDPGMWRIIDGGIAPENYAGWIAAWDPALVIVIDAAEMGAPPGCIRLLDWERAAGLSASTHTLPLTLLGRYLTLACGCDLALLGVQVGDSSVISSGASKDGARFGADLSPEVAAAAAEIVDALAEILTAAAVLGGEKESDVHVSNDYL
ncbi:MAG: hydrogenase maturation protease [Anaerolineae bacterium]|nr:hydrogenase maturation protease [Anaerolineae bacterium]NUQ04034.1 hydrogenase maturation protease [Anaerolineae bacterium]